LRCFDALIFSLDSHVGRETRAEEGAASGVWMPNNGNTGMRRMQCARGGRRKPCGRRYPVLPEVQCSDIVTSSMPSIADCHLHFFSFQYFRLLTEQRGVEPTDEAVEETLRLLQWELPPVSATKFAEKWIEELDRNGLSQAAILASLPGDEASVAEAVRAYPDRFFGYFFLNPIAPDATQRVRWALEAGLRGICLLPAMHRFSLRETGVEAVAKMAAETPGCVVFVHCGLLSVGVRGKLGLPSPFDMSYSNPIDLHALALRYPEVPFVIPHFGAGYFREALMLGHLCKNVYFDTSSSNSWTRFQEADLTLKDVLRKALDVVGPKRLMFGTNSTHFPAGWDRKILDQQLAAFQELGVGNADLADILGGNLRRILRKE